MALTKILFACLLSGFSVAWSQMAWDSLQTSAGTVRFGFYGHASLVLLVDGKRIYVDPVRQFTGNAPLPAADVILITHEHGDHLDSALVRELGLPQTRLVVNSAVQKILGRGKALANGDSVAIDQIRVLAVPAYNTTPGREKFHPRGRDNGYVLSFGGKRIYIAGDTEPIKEMQQLAGVDVAFLPVNQPYTMTPDQLVEALRLLRAQVVFPYHLGDTPLDAISAAAAQVPSTRVIIRDLR